MRPRPLISFVNRIISVSENKSQFSKQMVQKAETKFSLERFQAIEDEWRENLGDFATLCNFLRGTSNNRRVDNINEESFTDAYFNIGDFVKVKGILFEKLDNWRKSEIEFEVFRAELLYVLFCVGIIRIKKDPMSKLCFYYDEECDIQVLDFKNDAKISVHPSLYSYFKVNVKDQEVLSYSSE